MRTQRDQAPLHGDWATERGQEPGTIPALRCGRSAVADPAAVPARPFLIPGGPGATCPAPSGVHTPGPRPRLSWCPKLAGALSPARTPSARSHYSPQESVPLAASRALRRAESSPRSLSRSPRQSHRRRHSAAPRCISGRCHAGPTCAAAAGAPSVSAGAGGAGAGLQGGAGRLGPPLAPLSPAPDPWHPAPPDCAASRGCLEAGECGLRVTAPLEPRGAARAGGERRYCSCPSLCA